MARYRWIEAQALRDHCLNRSTLTAIVYSKLQDLLLRKVSLRIFKEYHEICYALGVEKGPLKPLETCHKRAL